ncbi:MAG: hypothetical protein KJS90_09605, partial [Acidobacteria bacterium]|nr:hypothetical protein [Acidobacteriota bacterium]
MSDRARPGAFGANSWLVEEMFEQFREDPSSVAPAWRDFFSDFRSAAEAAEAAATGGGPPSPNGLRNPAPARRTPVADTVERTDEPAPRAANHREVQPDPEPEALRGVGAAIA